jgi:hypothetical protein
VLRLSQQAGFGGESLAKDRMKTGVGQDVDAASEQLIEVLSQADEVEE